MKTEKVPTKFSRLNYVYDVYFQEPSEENLNTLLVEVEAAARKILRVKHDAHAFLMDSANLSQSNEISQQVMILVWRKLSKFHQESSFSSWVYRICQNAKIDAIRQSKRHREVSLEPCIDEQDDDDGGGLGAFLTSGGFYDPQAQFRKEPDEEDYLKECLEFFWGSLSAVQQKIIGLYLKSVKAAGIGKAFGRNSNWASKQLGTIKHILSAEIKTLNVL